MEKKDCEHCSKKDCENCIEEGGKSFCCQKCCDDHKGEKKKIHTDESNVCRFC
jgi:hypothetical protein